MSWGLLGSPGASGRLRGLLDLRASPGASGHLMASGAFCRAPPPLGGFWFAAFGRILVFRVVLPQGVLFSRVADFLFAHLESYPRGI